MSVCLDADIDEKYRFTYVILCLLLPVLSIGLATLTYKCSLLWPASEDNMCYDQRQRRI